MIMGPDGTRNQDLLCWRGPAAIYWTRLGGTKNHSAEVKVTLQLTVSHSVCLGVEPQLGLMTRCFFLFESYCPVHMGRPL
jgi:hypothetical protein